MTNVTAIASCTIVGVDNLIIFGAKYLIFILILVVLLVWLKTAAKVRWQFVAAVVLAGIAALILSKLASRFYFHHRPFVVQNFKPLIAHSDDNGFVSDHTLLATTLATSVYFYRHKVGIALVALAGLVGISRILAHVHWTIDVVGGLILGALAGWAGYQLATKLLPVNHHSPKSKELGSHT